jgi:hypothetical protein
LSLYKSVADVTFNFLSFAFNISLFRLVSHFLLVCRGAYLSGGRARRANHGLGFCWVGLESRSIGFSIWMLVSQLVSMCLMISTVLVLVVPPRVLVVQYVV